MYMPGSSTEMGMAMTTGPIDVCKTPSPAGPIPMPYPNIGQLRNANGTSTKVMIKNKPTVTKSSKISSSLGDQAGAVGGVISNTTGSNVVFQKGSSKVHAEGKPIVHLTAITGHNGPSNSNAPAGIHSVPSQASVFVHM